jgi:8-hydroxy-5-deazaflavin:NADPH oxidoreductase
MKTKQVIAVIGASGKTGAAIAKVVSRGNHRVLLHSPNRTKVQSVLTGIVHTHPDADVEIVDDLTEICWEADIVILAVPYGAEKQLADSIRSMVNQKVIIAVSVPLNEHDHALFLSGRFSAAEALQEQLPNARVVKLFNIELESNYYQPIGQLRKVDYFITGNDRDALNVVSELVTTTGFHPVIAGDLSRSRTLESMQFLLIQLNRHSKLNCLQ